MMGGEGTPKLGEEPGVKPMWMYLSSSAPSPATTLSRSPSRSSPTSMAPSTLFTPATRRS